MNSETEPQTPQRGHTMKIVIGALLLAVAAGLYAVLGGSGKPENLASASSCSISSELRAKLDQAAHGEVAAFRVVDEPTPLPELKFNDKDGVEKTMADWAGRTVLINLWATWCAPCRREMPALDALEAQLGGENFQVMPISLDLGKDDKPKQFYQKIGLKNLPFFHDATLETLNKLKKQGLAYGLPATLLVDTNGCILGNLNGPAEWASEDALTLIKASLKQ